MVNGASVYRSATTQLNEAPFKSNNIHLDSQSKFCCQD